MKKLIFSLSFLLITLFMVSCKQSGGADVGALTETYENRMDSLKISLMRIYNTTIDSMQSAHEAQIQVLQNQIANAAAPKQGITGSKNASTAPGSKPSGGKTAVPTTPGKVDVTKRGGNVINNLNNKVDNAVNNAKKKVDVTKRGGN